MWGSRGKKQAELQIMSRHYPVARDPTQGNGGCKSEDEGGRGEGADRGRCRGEEHKANRNSLVSNARACKAGSKRKNGTFNA